MEQALVPLIPPERRIYCNRTLNLRAVRAIGYDMDYTLIHYHVDEWERRAYEHIQQGLAAQDWPVGDLRFHPELFIRGLIIDRERGNILKANRFGYVKRASHGTRLLDFEEQRRCYERTRVDLAEPRWVFLNTLFSYSEACMYAQLVDLLDAARLPEVLGYSDLYQRVKVTLDRAHLEGELKDEIIAAPERFVELDADLPLALLDQRRAGKKLLLITNSEWSYTSSMMSYAFNRFLPVGTGWRELFDVVIVSTRKPDFFTQRMPLFEVVNEEGLLKPCPGGLRSGGIFLGGDATQVERHLGASGEEILYVGDHIFADVNVSKSVLRWRTALVLRELEIEVHALEGFAERERELEQLMDEKERLEDEHAHARLALQRRQLGYGPQDDQRGPGELQAELSRLRTSLMTLDEAIAPLAQAAAALANSRWGLLMRAGNDKSHLARQIERYADIYTSRASNFLLLTPFAYLRSTRGTLPHDLRPARPHDPDRAGE